MSDNPKFLDKVYGGKTIDEGCSKGSNQRDGFKPTAPQDLTLPKPTPAPKAPTGEKK
jgi:hypothetical protein